MMSAYAIGAGFRIVDGESKNLSIGDPSGTRALGQEEEY